MRRVAAFTRYSILIAPLILAAAPVSGQLIDRTKAPNVAKAGIAKSFAQEVGAGRGDVTTPNSSAFIIARDPFRAVRRGRQLFQRKFTRSEGHGPIMLDGVGDINTNLAIGAGLIDSCAGCHGRPRGSAGSGGNVVTRPDSRDAPHLFGLGLKEMLADEITQDLRAIRADAIATAAARHRDVTKNLQSKGIRYGKITAHADGSVDTSQVDGVDRDLRVRPFFHHGGTISIREFSVGAWNAEMGMQAVDPELRAAAAGGHFATPSGMVLDGSTDTLESPRAVSETDDPDGDGKVNEIPTALVDYMEWYLMHYFKAGTYTQDNDTARGRQIFARIGCDSCHIPDLTIEHDRRVADVDTAYNPTSGIFNHLFATAAANFHEVDDGTGFPTIKLPNGGSFVVKNFYADLKRHDLGPNFYENNYDGTQQKLFMTEPLWGVGTTGPYGHDGRSINLNEVILRHGGEAQASRDNYADLTDEQRERVLAFLNSLVLFPPDDTASNLDPGNPAAPGFPQFGHGSIKLTVLFNDPTDPE